MSELPVGWAEVTLGEIAETRLGKMLSAKARRGKDARPYLRNKNVQWGRIDLDDVLEMDFLDDELDRFRLSPGDLLVCEGGEVGRAAIWRGQVDWIGYQKALHRVRPAGGIAPEYTLYGFMWLAQTNAFDRHVTGSTIKHLPQEDLRLLRLPLPPLNEQRRIVAAIEEHLSRLDAADASVEAAGRRLGALAKETLGRAINEWPERPLGEFSRVFVGTTPSRRRPELWSGDVPWVSSGEVAFCRISATRETISAEAVGSTDRLHPAGTVLLGMIGEGKTRGQAAILDVAATHNQNSAAIRLDPTVCSPEWLFYVFMARYEDTRRAGSGGQQPALNAARVASLRIPLPPLEEQRRIVAEVEERLSAIDALRAAIERAQRRSAALRRAVLERAFRGELVPQDPSDEPAEALLARIRAKRADTVPARRRAWR